jgi:hypothetical protein
VLSFDTVHALTACLLHVQHDAPRGRVAADLLGTVVLVHDRPVTPAGSRPRHLRVLRLPLHDEPGQRQSLPAVLDRIADALLVHDRSSNAENSLGDGLRRTIELDILRTGLHAPGLRLLAWAVCYDDVLADDEDVTVVRRVEAVDVDGRVYQLSLQPRDAHPVVLVDEQPDPGDLPATYPALVRLATASPPAQA